MDHYELSISRGVILFIDSNKSQINHKGNVITHALASYHAVSVSEVLQLQYSVAITKVFLLTSDIIISCSSAELIPR